MKPKIFSLILLIQGLSASAFAQLLTLKEKNTPLLVVTDKINARTGYDTRPPKY